MRRSETAPLLRQNLRLSRRFCLSEASFVWDVPSQTHVPGKNKIPDNPRWRAFYSRCVGDFPCGHFPVLLPKAMTRSPSLQEIRGRPRLDCAAGPFCPCGSLSSRKADSISPSSSRLTMLLRLPRHQLKHLRQKLLQLRLRLLNNRNFIFYIVKLCAFSVQSFFYSYFFE